MDQSLAVVGPRLGDLVGPQRRRSGPGGLIDRARPPGVVALVPISEPQPDPAARDLIPGAHHDVATRMTVLFFVLEVLRP